jgi:hypothetical protein
MDLLAGFSVPAPLSSMVLPLAALATAGQVFEAAVREALTHLKRYVVMPKR